MMKLSLAVLTLLLFDVNAAVAQWRTLAPGVQFQQFSPDPPFTFHVAKVDMENGAVRVVASSEADRGSTVSKYADRTDALVAINGGFFDAQMRPDGVTVGPCGRWSKRSAQSARKEPVLAIGRTRAQVLDAGSDKNLPSWVQHAITGWPALVRDCRAFTSTELPGSDAFTRTARHRTAVGVSRDGKSMYLVVADGQKNGAYGVTLAVLGKFMRDELDVCAAVNLDGGGSSAMAVNEKLASRLSGDGERMVANHLAVVLAAKYKGCELPVAGSTEPLITSDWWKDVEEVLGRKADRRNGVAQFYILRPDLPMQISGARVGTTLAGNSSLRFERSGATTLLIGELLLREEEVAKVLEKLGAASIRQTALHRVSTDVDEVVMILHVSGKGEPAVLAHAVRAALDSLNLKSR